MNKLDDATLVKLNFLSAFPTYTSICVMKILGLTATLFGHDKEADMLKEHADGMWASRIGRILCSVVRMHAPLPVLVQTDNVSEGRVLFNDKEKKVARKILKAIDPNLKSNFLGLKRNGVSFGMVLTFIEEFYRHRPSSEEELIKVAALFSDGCLEKGVGIQRAKDVLQPKRGFELKVLGYDFFTFVKTLAPFANLVCQEDWDFDFRNFTTVEKTKRKFDGLSNGTYLLKFYDEPNQGEKYHVIAFIKNQFGDYFFDPIIGLMKSTDPSKDLARLLTLYPGDPIFSQTERHMLEVFQLKNSL